MSDSGAWTRRLAELGVRLPAPPPPVANFLPARHHRGLLFVSGQGPVANGQPVLTGRVGAGVTVEEAYAAARLCALNSVAVAAERTGGVDRIVRVVKVLAFVASSDDFHDQPSVVNGASDLLVDLFGDAGRHARSAIGTHSLPFAIPVEIEVAFEIDDAGMRHVEALEAR